MLGFKGYLSCLLRLTEANHHQLTLEWLLTALLSGISSMLSFLIAHISIALTNLKTLDLSILTKKLSDFLFSSELIEPFEVKILVLQRLLELESLLLKLLSSLRFTLEVPHIQLILTLHLLKSLLSIIRILKTDEPESFRLPVLFPHDHRTDNWTELLKFLLQILIREILLRKILHIQIVKLPLPILL